MNRINILHQLKVQLHSTLRRRESYVKQFISICILMIIAAVIWFGSPHFTWQGYAPFIQPEKRLYVILFCILAWILKFVLFDMDTDESSTTTDGKTNSKLEELQKRFSGAIQFLKKTTITKHGKEVCLNQLPWYLLVGPENAGKTSLLANAGTNYILQRQFQRQDTTKLAASENCDWWITRDACLVDVPSNYFYTDNTSHTPALWRSFLRLIKSERGKHGIDGVIIAIPLPEIMRQNDARDYQKKIRGLFSHLHEIQKLFQGPIPCQIVITKCDLLSGFTEFFAEASNEEIVQAWGLALPALNAGEKAQDIFRQRFNMLIKKLNEQLLWRLHQERNPMARPYIKDFPLQVERVKEMAADFIKKLSIAPLALSVQGIYLMSALQEQNDANSTIIDEPYNDTARALQLFKAPAPVTRAYFVKHFITHGIGGMQTESAAAAVPPSAWKQRAAYATSFAAIALTALFLGRDFQQGIKQTQAIQTDIANYHLALKVPLTQTEHLLTTIDLLNKLQQSTKNTHLVMNVSYFLSFYSNKSQQKAQTIYQQALRVLLVPELQKYLEEYLQNPVNKNGENIYSALKAYLMLGDNTNFQPDFIIQTLQTILPKAMQNNSATELAQHLDAALKVQWHPLTLNANLVQDTRRFLVAIPPLRLGYIILKNIDSNNHETEINMGTNTSIAPIFTSRQVINQIPAMFTAQTYPVITNQEIEKSAREVFLGNWVLGTEFANNKNPELIASLVDQLRMAYINNYVDIWETLLSNIHLINPGNLAQTDALITQFMSNGSPLLQLLQTVHDNTYFEPIVSASPKLQSLSILIEKNTETDISLYQIFSGLQNLHQYLQLVLSAENPDKTAFDILTTHMRHDGTPDAITQMRLISLKAPEPLKNWLEKITDHSWHFLMQSASRYINLAWQNKVGRVYQTEIANRYPFTAQATHEVDIQKFIHFFGKPGIVIDFYNNYLVGLVDSSQPEWRWKTTDHGKLPFTDETLRQIQQAMRINHAFFPNGDNKLYLQFALQPYRIGKNIKRIRLTINNKQFIDERGTAGTPHIIAWPNNIAMKNTSVQFTMNNEKSIYRDFPGAWGWFKLINQSLESAVSNKQMSINLSMNDQTAKYWLFTEGQYNPFVSLNLSTFNLPFYITDQKT